MTSLIIVSNRTPGDKPAAGGLAVALKKVLQEREGFWFGWSGEFAETPDKEPQFKTVDGISIGTIDLTEQDYRRYYEGYSNSVLWPAFHHRLDLIEFGAQDYEAYLSVSRQFAAALKDRIGPDDIIWVHDYQLIPLARELRRLDVRNKIGFFLHIPMPGPEIFSAIPNHGDLLDCLAAYDLTGLQAQRDVEKLTTQQGEHKLPSTYDPMTGSPDVKPMVAEAFPIGTDPEAFGALAKKKNARRTAKLVEKSLAGRKLIFGVDRLDYSKGLPERILGYERLLELFPEWQRKVHLLQIAPPSRGNIAEYQEINDQLDDACGRVMGRFAELDWAPLNYVKRTYPQTALAGIYRIARVAMVTPLRDGMNLVAHEFIASQKPSDPGVLMLSRFAGAAELFPEALMVNPHDIDEMAHVLDTALRMPKAERIERWQAMIKTVEERSVDNWASSFIRRLETIASGDDTNSDPPRAAA